MYVKMCLSGDSKISKWNDGAAPTEVAINPADYPATVQYLKDKEAAGESTSIHVLDMDSTKTVCLIVASGRIYEMDYDCADIVCCVDNGGAIDTIPAAVKAELETLNALV